MLFWLILGVAGLGLAMLGARWFASVPPGDLVRAARTFVAVFGALAGSGLLMMGRAGLAFVVLAAAFMAGKALWANRRPPDPMEAGQAARGPSSAVETGMLRMCLDHADKVSRAAVLDIVPTRTVFEATDQDIATAYYHWFFLIQAEPLPERLIGADPIFYLHRKLGQWSGGRSPTFTEPAALAEYERAFSEPAVIHASCEDYRAAASIDIAHDRADEAKRIACPLLALWGEKGFVHRRFDPLMAWREKASGTVDGRALPCGHFLPEEAPDAVNDHLVRWLDGLTG